MMGALLMRRIPQGAFSAAWDHDPPWAWGLKVDQGGSKANASELARSH